MLEKLVEMVREQIEGSGDALHFEFPCYACPSAPRFGSECGEEEGWCPNIDTPLEVQFKLLARWAVLLVAKTLEDGYEEYLSGEPEEWMKEQSYKMSRERYMEMMLHDLIAEAKELKNE